ncbi:hypothetical protein EON65_33850 [archaeon]|nr:MAG: hypothetical protein EON65_33850 [archaeon]
MTKAYPALLLKLKPLLLSLQTDYFLATVSDEEIRKLCRTTNGSLPPLATDLRKVVYHIFPCPRKFVSDSNMSTVAHGGGEMLKKVSLPSVKEPQHHATVKKQRRDVEPVSS